MEKHPIESLMNTAMSNLKDMIDVNTVVGEAIDAGNGTTIIPVSKVCFGFAAGGCEFNSGTLEQYSKQGVDEDISYKLPFGGGSGAAAHLMPMGFLVVSQDSVKMLPVNHCSAIDKLLDYVPDLFDKIGKMWNAERTYTYEFYDDDDECVCGCMKEECSSKEENDESENVKISGNNIKNNTTNNTNNNVSNTNN